MLGRVDSWLGRSSGAQLQKLLQRRRKGAAEEEQQDSGSEPRGDEDDIPLGPQSNVSLLDQHQHLKEKAEGGLESRGEVQRSAVLGV